MKTTVIFLVSLFTIGTVTTTATAQNNQPLPASIFGDFDKDIGDFQLEVDIANFCLFQSYLANNSDDVTKAFFQVYLYGLNVNASIYPNLFDFNIYLASLDKGRLALYQAAQILYNGKNKNGPLIDISAFGAALGTAKTKAGWSANRGKSDEYSWYALWFILYAAGNIEDFTAFQKANMVP